MRGREGEDKILTSLIIKNVYGDIRCGNIDKSAI